MAVFKIHCKENAEKFCKIMTPESVKELEDNSFWDKRIAEVIKKHKSKMAKFKAECVKEIAERNGYGRNGR